MKKGFFNAPTNQVTASTLSRLDDQSATETVVFEGFTGGFVAIYGTVLNTGQTFFGNVAANADGYAHFKYLEAGKVGFEDGFGGFDKDHNDLSVTLRFV